MAIEDGAVLTRALGMTDDIARGAADLSAQPRRPHRQDGAAIERQPRAVPPAIEAEIRARFSKSDEGEDRNSWLYSYNPLTVELK